jgi:hypothetical protein
MNAEGGIDFLYACDEILESAELQLREDSGEEGETLWRIVPTGDAQPVRQATVGETPPGYRTEVTLASIQGSRARFALGVEATVNNWQVFRFRDLRTDLWLQGTEHVTEERLIEEAKC